MVPTAVAWTVFKVSRIDRQIPSESTSLTVGADRFDTEFQHEPIVAALECDWLCAKCRNPRARKLSFCLSRTIRQLRKLRDHQLLTVNRYSYLEHCSEEIKFYFSHE